MTFGISIKDFRTKVGEDQYKKLLSSLTVREKIHPGKPKNIIQNIKSAYYIEDGLLFIPRIKKLKLMQIPGLFTATEILPAKIKKRFAKTMSFVFTCVCTFSHCLYLSLQIFYNYFLSLCYFLL